MAGSHKGRDVFVYVDGNLKKVADCKVEIWNDDEEEEELDPDMEGCKYRDEGGHPSSVTRWGPRLSRGMRKRLRTKMKIVDGHPVIGIGIGKEIDTDKAVFFI